MAKSIVGPVINSRGIIYGPTEKFGVMFIFAKLADDLGFFLEEVNPEGPKAILRREIKNGLERVDSIFAFKSSEANHDDYLSDCDLLVCWNHDWQECPVEVIELRSRFVKTSAARFALDKVVGKTHQSAPNTKSLSVSKGKEEKPAPESENPVNRDELQQRFNKTIQEIDEKIKDLF